MCEYCNAELMGDGDNKKLIEKYFDFGLMGKCQLMVDVFAPEDEPARLSVWLEFPHSNLADARENGNDILAEPPINYCPMCGRKLREEDL